MVGLPLGGSHIILTIAQVHEPCYRAGGSRQKIERALSRTKQTDLRTDIAKEQLRFGIFTIRVMRLSMPISSDDPKGLFVAWRKAAPQAAIFFFIASSM
jgi:hypothetical protein